MSQIVIDADSISLSSSPNFSFLMCSQKKYKLLETKNIEIQGTFLLQNSLTAMSDTFLNIDTLYVRLNTSQFNINVGRLDIEDSIGSIKGKVCYSDIYILGETMQREFYILDTENIVIKIIKNISKYNNIVEITKSSTMTVDDMRTLGNRPKTKCVCKCTSSKF